MNEIEKYIKDNYAKSGEAELRKELVSQGYRPEDFEGYFENMKKSKSSRATFYIVLGIILLVAILVKLFIVNPMPQTGIIKDKVITESIQKYSSDPKDWITKDSILDVPAATNGSGYVDSSTLQYMDGSVNTAFTYDGYYQGKYFTNSYSEEGKTLIEITGRLNTTDGIPQIIVVEKINKDNNSVKAMIFVDEDWKKQIVPTYVRWGINFEKNKMFDYSNSPKQGIYMDVIDDSARFNNNFNVHFGGIAIGDITQEKIDRDELNVTYVNFR